MGQFYPFLIRNLHLSRYNDFLKCLKREGIFLAENFPWV